MARLFRTVIVVVFGCVTLWHCCGCDLLDPPAPPIETFSTSELIEELVDRGFERLVGEEDD